MPRIATPLTAAKVKTAKPGRYHDGDGLVLLVRPAPQPDAPDRAFWLFRYSNGGRVREAGLGRARGPNAASLGEARERARRLRDKVRDGKDPIDAKQAEKAAAKTDAAKAQAGAVTFRQVADMYIAAHEAGWRNPKHRQQWRNTLDQYVLPVLGELPVAAVDTGAVVKIIEPLWREKTETANRVRGRIDAAFRISGRSDCLGAGDGGAGIGQANFPLARTARSKICKQIDTKYHGLRRRMLHSIGQLCSMFIGSQPCHRPRSFVSHRYRPASSEREHYVTGTRATTAAQTTPRAF